MPSAKPVVGGQPDAWAPVLLTYIDNIVIPVKGTTTADIDAALTQAASAAANGNAAVVLFPPGSYVTTGGHIVAQNVHLRGHGPATAISHTGNNICFDCSDAGTFALHSRRSIKNLHLSGNSGAAAIGVKISNQWGFEFDMQLDGYSGTNGIGLLVRNDFNWCEGSKIQGMIRGCKRDICFERTNGTSSFGYTELRGVALQVAAGCIGIDFGGASTNPFGYYNGIVEAVIWLEGTGAIGINVTNMGTVDDTNRADVRGEYNPASGFTSLYGVQNTGGVYTPQGITRFFNDPPNNLTSGRTTVNYAMGRPGSITAVMPSLTGQGAYSAGIALSNDGTEQAVILYGYDNNSDNGALYVVGKPGAADPGAPFNPNGNLAHQLFVVSTDRNVGVGHNDARRAQGFGTGEGGVLSINNATVVPSTNVTGKGLLYSQAGAGKWRGTSGTITTFGPAEPHCPDCGRDFALEWESEEYGHLSLCMWCVSEGMARGVIAREEAT